jgi:uncharacterized protein YndB with AHSA1/START domain
MLARITGGILVLIVALVIAIATRPDTFRIERTATIAAPAEVVFAQIDDFHRWERWSPFEKVDPNVRRSYEGAPAGVGAIYHYVGNSKVGEGRMTVTESKPGERVAIKAEFIKPLATTNQVEFTLVPAANGVSVTWAMSGHQPFVGKAISLFINMDKMVGAEFENGLAALKRVSEAEAKGGTTAPVAARGRTATTG